jgi:Ca2+-binding EF-hand superfamily protein
VSVRTWTFITTALLLFILMYKRRKSSQGKMAETTARAIFSHYDKDGNGFLEPNEVLQFIRELTPQQEG